MSAFGGNRGLYSKLRWTSILSEKLGENYHVVEEGLCGRTTIFDDPLRDGRCGVKMLPTLLESHSPIDLTTIMLGTNDCKTVYGATSKIIAKGVKRLIHQVRNHAENSRILIISPIHLGKNISEYDSEFSESSIKISEMLAESYQKICKEENVFFMDASEYAEPSDTDREHMNETGHAHLAEAVFQKVKEII